MYLHWSRQRAADRLGVEHRVRRSFTAEAALIQPHLSATPGTSAVHGLSLVKQAIMNPSVEESKDEARTGAPPPGPGAENGQFSWSKVSE